MELDQFRDVDVVLDKANDNIIQKQFVSAGDKDGRSLTAQLTDNGVIGEIIGAALNLYWHNQASGLTDLSAFYVVDRATSVFKIDYPQNMLTPGKVIAYIQILHGGKVTHTKPFEITVQKLAGTTRGVLATAEYGALVTTLAKANEFETEIAKKADKTQVDVLGSELDIARGGSQTLGDRLDSEKAEVTAQLARADKFQLEQRNAKMPLPISTYDGSGQATHPSVVDTGVYFSGFRYWMAYTPYPFSDDDYENPCIQYSNNGMEWGGDLTPIDKPTPQQTNDGAYMSDVELKYINGQLECFYRFNTATEEVLLRKTSTNGTTWSEREIIYNSPAGGAMSPTVVHENGLYRMWYVRNTGDIFYVESSTAGLGTWSTPIIVPISYRNESYRPWHIQVFKDTDNTYKLILNAFEQGSTFRRHLLIGTSTDGLTFENTYLFMSPLSRSYVFDKDFLYRACLLKGPMGYMFYYSAYSVDVGWHIGLSVGKTIDGIQGIDYTTLTQQKMLQEIRTPKVEIKDGAYFANDELYFQTRGVKSVKLKNSFPNELNLLNQQGNPARFLSKEIGLSTGSTGGNIGPSGVQNVLQIRNNSNNGPGHLEVAHLLLKDTTNTLNVEGALRYSPTKKKLEFYNGTSWETVTSS